jgi:hypothetical protein
MSVEAASIVGSEQDSAGPVDALRILPSGAVRLSGHLSAYIDLSIQAWIKDKLPYPALASMFRDGRPIAEFDGERISLFATGEMWGKAVRSAALFYRYTRDPDLKELLVETVADLLTMRRSNGTISCSPEVLQPDGPGGDLWERKYVLLALDEYYVSVEPDSAVLQAMIDQVDATLAQVGPPPKRRIVDLGWSRDLVAGNNIESSTILEPVLRLYRHTGEKRFLDFASYIVEVEGGALHHNLVEEILTGMDLVEVGGVYPKAYEMLSYFEGIIEYYRATGNRRWCEAAKAVFAKAIDREITIVGNGGGDQPFHPNVRGEAWDNSALEQTNPAIERMMETCTGVTWLKFCAQLLRLSADPVAADYIELYAYNGLLGAMKPEGDGFSYVNLLNGVKTDKEGWGAEIDGVYITCCNLNGPEALAHLPWIAVMEGPDGPHINLYEAGEYRVPLAAGGEITLNLETEYPLEGDVRVTITSMEKAEFVVSLRMPSWSHGTSVKVNNEEMKVEPGAYAKVGRRWSVGDRIDVKFDMRTRLIRARKGISQRSDRFVAVMRGPIVFTRDENIDDCFAEPVEPVALHGYVEASRCSPTCPHTKIEIEVPTTTGSIRMVDYASADSWHGKRVQTWLPMSAAS